MSETLLHPHAVEQKIADLTERLEEQVTEYEKACDRDARMEARWKRLYFTAVVEAAAHPDNVRGGRLGDAEARKGYAHRVCTEGEWVARALDLDEIPDHPDPYAAHLIAASVRDSAKEALRSTQSALSAQQTLLRSLTHNLT